MRTLQAKLLTVAPVAHAFPESRLPEIAVVGRSNAGKSTLINLLVGQHHLARVSGKPGKTRAIIFFDIESRFNLVDLPGYGFARGPREDQASWRDLVQAYFSAQRKLVGVMALFDIRRKPDELDTALLDLLNRYRLPFRAVFTKADKLKRSQVERRCREIADSMDLQPGNWTAFSKQTRTGREELLNWVESQVASGVKS